MLARRTFAGATVAGRRPDPRVLHGRPLTVALAVTNLGVVANMIHRHGVRNTILPLYAASVLGLGGFSIATAIAAMAISGFVVMAPAGCSATGSGGGG